MQVTVVGAGVIGLVTARVLAEHGHAVRVVASEVERTTSTVAGAVWFPFRAGPPERVPVWARTTRAWLSTLPHDAGVDPLVGYEVSEDDNPWWAAGIDIERVELAGARAWKYPTVRVEPALFLPWIARGLEIERRTVANLDAEPGDVVVDCRGLAARVDDPLLQPLFGQVVISEPGDVDLGVTITDERAELFYVIPRRRELVLGGCTLIRDALDPDPAITERILARARELGLRPGPVKHVRTGLRPSRPTVRLEREGRIVRNYGHGGAGYTLCYGCAEDVARLLT